MKTMCIMTLLLLLSSLTDYDGVAAKLEDELLLFESKQVSDDLYGPKTNMERNQSVYHELPLEKEKRLELTHLELKRQIELQQEQKLALERQLLATKSADIFPTEIIVASIGATATVAAALIAVSKRK